MQGDSFSLMMQSEAVGRTTEVHRNRIDFEACIGQKNRHWKKLNIGIVGGGISEMLLNKLGHDVTIWDKSD